MKRVVYGGESFITSDDGAEALLDFAASAAMLRFAEVVGMPSVRADGGIALVRLVIGPSSQLIASPVESTWPEPDTAEASRMLRARASELEPSSPRSRGSALANADLDASDPEPY
jgi:hypothetical protein